MKTVLHVKPRAWSYPLAPQFSIQSNRERFTILIIHNVINVSACSAVLVDYLLI